MAVSTTVINTVARRLRDTANLAYPRAVMIRFVDHAQRVVNAYTKAVINSVSVATSGLHTFSPLYTGVPASFSSVENIALDGKTLNRIDPWQSIVHQDPEWFGTVGPRYIAWATIGKDFLILYPIVSPLPVGSFLTIDFVPQQPSVILDNGTNDIVLPDDLIDVLQDLVEVLGLVKGRRWSEAADPIARFQQTLEIVGSVYNVQDVGGRV